jgi:hypothetical protein
MLRTRLISKEPADLVAQAWTYEAKLLLKIERHFARFVESWRRWLSQDREMYLRSEEFCRIYR